MNWIILENILLKLSFGSFKLLLNNLFNFIRNSFKKKLAGRIQTHPGGQSCKTSTFLEDFGLHSRVDQRGRRERRSLGTLIARRGKTSLSKTTNFGFLIGFVFLRKCGWCEVARENISLFDVS